VTGLCSSRTTRSTCDMLCAMSSVHDARGQDSARGSSQRSIVDLPLQNFRRTHLDQNDRGCFVAERRIANASFVLSNLAPIKVSAGISD
jgi:hypothetical protein